MRTKTIALFFLFLYIQSIACESGTKGVEKRHKSKKTEKTTEQTSNAETPSPKKIKPTQRPKARTTKAVVLPRQDEMEAGSSLIANETAIEKPSAIESAIERRPKSVTTSTTSQPPNISTTTEINYEASDVIPPTVGTDCNPPTKKADCNETSNATTSNPIETKRGNIIIAKIEVKESNKTINVSIPDSRNKTKSKDSNNTTTIIDINMDSDNYEQDAQDKIENTAVEKLDDAVPEASDMPNRILDAKKKKKVVVRKNTIKRRVSKKSKAKAKKEKKAKKAKISPTSASDVDVDIASRY